jgi:adenylylsulfate kinase
MLTDIILHYYRKDPTIRRHIAKSISWRILGTVDTVILGFIITGKLSTGLKIGGLELFTKILLYFLHERIWLKIPFGQPRYVERQRRSDTSETNLFRQDFAISRNDRQELSGHKAFTIWLTGLSGSGKSTLSSALDKWFHEQKIRSFIIDGDNTRMGINSDLNFTREGRKENIRRVAELCRLFNEAGVVVISSFISPFQSDRESARQIIGDDSFKEVYVAASLEKCMSRDVKGLYTKAKEGKIKDFTGLTSPYEAPTDPDLIINTDVQSTEESFETLRNWLMRQEIFTSKVDAAPTSL